MPLQHLSATFTPALNQQFGMGFRDFTAHLRDLCINDLELGFATFAPFKFCWCFDIRLYEDIMMFKTHGSIAC